MVLIDLADGLSVFHRVTAVVPRKTPRGARQDELRKLGGAWEVLDYVPSRVARLISTPADDVSLPLLRRYAHGRAGIPAARLFGSVVGRSLAADLPKRPDVVHAFTADMTAHLALGLGHAARSPVVLTGFPHPGQYGNGPIDASAYRAADGIVALTEHDRDVYRQLGAPRGRVFVIPPPSDDLGVGGKGGARERLGIQGRLVLFVGVRREYKGARILHDAAPRIAARVDDVTVAFVGPGDPIPPVEGARIQDVGEVDSETMHDWIRAADVLVLPSLHEIFPLVVLEAWSAGVPVVLSDIPPLLHLIRVSGGGVAVPRRTEAVAEGVVELLNDGPRRTELGDAGRRYWQEHCAPETIITAYHELYARLTAAHGGGSGNVRHR
jgi:glycosyltransferase involved in cell wall biosynthesis